MSEQLDRRGQLDLEAAQHRVDFNVGHVRVTSAGVREFDVRITYAEVLDVARVASAMVDTGKWVLGDILNYVETRKSRPHDEWSYEQIAAETGRSIGGVMNIKSVCKRVPYDVRRPWLAWSIHEAIARLDRAGQIRMLDRVEAERLSVEELRGLLRPPDELTGPVRSADSEALPVLEGKGAESSRTGNFEAPSPPSESLRDVARAISNTCLPGPGDVVCMGADLLVRLRLALGEGGDA